MTAAAAAAATATAAADNSAGKKGISTWRDKYAQYSHAAGLSTANKHAPHGPAHTTQGCNC
jgi:hypothetical protein